MADLIAKNKIDWTGEKKVNLALQGGGSHGAFTWGVLDAILEDGRLDIEAISGTSAGAMNAVAFVQGYMEGGRDGARATLEKFWSSVCEESSLTSTQRDLFDRFFGQFNYDNSPFQTWINFVSQISSPYQLNPLNINPLRDHLESIVDFKKVRACKAIKLFIAATNVHTGRITVFERDTLTADQVMASACLPTMFQAVEIDGVPYWDGGFIGNPALFPLFYKASSEDIIIVQVNPVERKQTPQTANDIQNRINEITFNSALMGELRAVDFVNRLVESGNLSHKDYKHPLVHRIGGDEASMYSAASKMDTRWPFLQQLRDEGRKATQHWLKDNYENIGVKGTLDLRFAFN
ncbi:MAG: patatin-like phospholipase family protein [Beijerinckiaceae bacterium]|nr:patatin-like phospholipase family protein [Beijerinckiaceae bacterium]